MRETGSGERVVGGVRLAVAGGEAGRGRGVSAGVGGRGGERVAVLDLIGERGGQGLPVDGALNGRGRGLGATVVGIGRIAPDDGHGLLGDLESQLLGTLVVALEDDGRLGGAGVHVVAVGHLVIVGRIAVETLDGRLLGGAVVGVAGNGNVEGDVLEVGVGQLLRFNGEAARGGAGVVALAGSLHGDGAHAGEVVGLLAVALVDEGVVGAGLELLAVELHGDGRGLLGAVIGEAVDRDLGIGDARPGDLELDGLLARIVALEGDGRLGGSDGGVVLVGHLVVGTLFEAGGDARHGRLLLAAAVGEAVLRDVKADGLELVGVQLPGLDGEAARGGAGIVALAGDDNGELAGAGEVVGGLAVALVGDGVVGAGLEGLAAGCHGDVRDQLLAVVGEVVDLDLGARDVGRHALVGVGDGGDTDLLAPGPVARELGARGPLDRRLLARLEDLAGGVVGPGAHEGVVRLDLSALELNRKVGAVGEFRVGHGDVAIPVVGGGDLGGGGEHLGGTIGGERAGGGQRASEHGSGHGQRRGRRSDPALKEILH